MSAAEGTGALALRETRGASAADFAVCRAWIAEHSKSFYLSSLLLPAEVRRRAWALYAFCRRADDAVDEVGPGPTGDPTGGPADGAASARGAVQALRRRLQRVYAGEVGAGPDEAVDRAFALVCAEAAIPQALPARLLLGMEQDAPEGQDVRYRTWDELLGYCFNVASTVGLMMTAVMGHVAGADRTGEVMVRAADLGVAMQLTNIARDVGEDARRGRVYLPADLLAAAGSSDAEVLDLAARGAPPSPGLRRAVEALLGRAAAHYAAADRGIPLLRPRCRLAIRSARLIYAAIGDRVAARGFDSLTGRAHVSLFGKLRLVARAALQRPALPGVGGDAAGPADALLLRLCAEVGMAP